MKIHINSLNQILYEFVMNEALPKYESIWRSNGDNNAALYTKMFVVTIGAKLGLRGEVLQKFPIFSMYLDNQNLLDLDELKEVALETLKEFKDKGKKVVIPKIDWELDEYDIEKLYEISQKFKVEKEGSNGDES